MHKSICLVIALAALGMCACSNALTDLGGWDLSACEGHLDVCTQLFTDNQERLFGGSGLLDSVFDGLL